MHLMGPLGPFIFKAFHFPLLLYFSKIFEDFGAFCCIREKNQTLIKTLIYIKKQKNQRSVSSGNGNEGNH